MCETIVQSVKAFILPKFIKHSILNTRVNVYTKKGIAYYIMRTFIFNEMSRLQYNLLIGCSTIILWHKYGIIIGKLRMFIFIAMEMEKLYGVTGIQRKQEWEWEREYLKSSLFIKFYTSEVHRIV